MRYTPKLPSPMLHYRREDPFAEAPGPGFDPGISKPPEEKITIAAVVIITTCVIVSYSYTRPALSRVSQSHTPRYRA